MFTRWQKAIEHLLTLLDDNIIKYLMSNSQFPMHDIWKLDIRNYSHN